MKHHAGRVLAVNEVATVSMGDEAFVMRVASAESLDAAERADAIGYHCFRGRLLPDTAVYMVVSDVPGTRAPLWSDAFESRRI